MASEYSLRTCWNGFIKINWLGSRFDGADLWVEQQNALEVGKNVRGALHTIGENAGHIKQGLARLKGADLA